MSRSGNRQAGRIHPHQRDADDETPLLGASITNLGDAYEQNYNETIRMALDDKTRRDYRRRIVCICKYWEEHLPEYFVVVGAREIGVDEGNQPHFFYNHQYKYDVVYPGLNVKFFIAFLMANERKENGKMKSFVDPNLRHIFAHFEIKEKS